MAVNVLSYIADVQGVSLRAVAGEAGQVELWVRCKGGDFTLRLIPQRGRTVRLVDLRSRDRRKANKPTLGFDDVQRTGRRATDKARHLKD